MLVPKAMFGKYVSAQTVDSLTDYLGRLSNLHSSYRGLQLNENAALGDARQIAESIMSTIQEPLPGHPASLWKKRHTISVLFDRFEWDVTIQQFRVNASFLDNDFTFQEAYGNEESFLDQYARSWGSIGICDALSQSATHFKTMSNAWSVYLDSKNMDVSKTNYSTRVLDVCANYPVPQQLEVSVALETLQNCIEARYGNELTYKTIDGDYLVLLTREIDAHLIDTFGHTQFEQVVSAFGMPLAQWLANPSKGT